MRAGFAASWCSAGWCGHSKSPQKTFPESRALLSEQEKDEEGLWAVPAFPLWPEVAEEAAEGGQAKPRLHTTVRLGWGGRGKTGAR